MMRDLYEVFFCPIHGLFRPDNVVLFMVYGENILAVARTLAFRMQGVVNTI